MRCAVLGSPVAHSLSPAMHRAAYAEAGLGDWTYDAVEVADDGLPGFLDGLDHTWRGLSLTMPLKRHAVPLVDSLDEWATVSQAVNTVLLGERGRRGLNTDVPGARAALVEHGVDALGDVVVLGGGATATSTLLAAAGLGCRRARLLVRDPARVAQTVRLVEAAGTAVSVDTLGAGFGRPDLVVSTVPVAAQTPALVDAAVAAPVVFEVVYDPWPTPLAAAALQVGRTVVDGLDLLAHQAVLQLRAMAGVDVPPGLLREAALAELRGRGAPVEKVPPPPHVT